MTLDKERLPQSLDSDRRRAFITDGAIHLVNKQSCNKLLLQLYSKYKNDENLVKLCYAEPIVFRPSIVIDDEFDVPYIEDDFQELRIANVFFRQIGPCSRCKTTSLNWNFNIRHPNLEPFTTLCQVRKHHQYGPCFGTYIQPDIVTTKEQYKELLPDYPEIKDRSFGPTAIIKKGDFLMVRKK